MSTYTQILYQLVFSTKNREKTMTEAGQEKLYKFIWGILKNKNCHLYRINGVENHLHIILYIHPSISLAGLVKDIKLASYSFIKETKIFPLFQGWQVGYGAFTYSYSAKEKLTEYVRNQKQHHQIVTFKEEYIALLQEHGIKYDKKYIWL